MPVQTPTPTRYRRIKEPRIHIISDLKRSKFSDLAGSYQLKGHSHFITPDFFSSIGDVSVIYECKNAQINSTIDKYASFLNKYYPSGPTFATLKFANVKSSLPALVKSRIQQLERLPEAWDSYSAKPIDNRAIEAAKALLIRISSDFSPELISNVFIAPCSDGGVQLEWELNSKELIIKITPDSKHTLFLFVSPPDTKEGIITSQAQLDSLLKGILSP